ncbi:MAG: hypothetical protein ACP5F3_04160 [Candidatus Syntrophosphaera sp.]
MLERILENHPRLGETLHRLRYMAGAKVIRILMESPGKSIPVPEICRRIYRPDLSPSDFTRLWEAAFRPLPGIDARARREYSVRLKKLKALEASGVEDPELDWEAAWLEAELKRHVRKGGALKKEAPELELAYHGLYTAVWKLLRKVKKSDPEIFFLLRANLVTGHSFLWRSSLKGVSCTELRSASSVKPAA